MKTATPKAQWGLSFTEFLIGAVALIVIAVIALKLIPAYLQNSGVERIFVAIADDPEMQRANIADIRASYSKRAMIDDITAIKAEDIRIASLNGKLQLSASYGVMLPLVGNVNLYLEFNPSSAD